MGLALEEIESAHRLIRDSKFMASLLDNDRYPFSMLFRYARDFVSYIKKTDLLAKIQNKEIIAPRILEIHPTNGHCIYKCKMCIWCGGKNFSVQDFYGNIPLLKTKQWFDLLEEAKSLGVEQLIFSGGGEPLHDRKKFEAVLRKANDLGFRTMIYTNGRLLFDLPYSAMETILRSSWLRISVHSTDPDAYAKVTGRPRKANDLAMVLNGIKRLNEAKKKNGSNLKLGIGTVLQEANYSEVTAIHRLAMDLEVDFLDLRFDCIGAKNNLNKNQKQQMFVDIQKIRDMTSGPRISIADDLTREMDGWKETKIDKPCTCRIPYVRPAIDPYGIVGACDSIGEPYTRSRSPQEYVLGSLQTESFAEILRRSQEKTLPLTCKFCMPGQISINAFLDKILDDSKYIKLESQYFAR
jgi:molybdenum cofactor biosynthesis enzyme MoaA